LTFSLPPLTSRGDAVSSPQFPLWGETLVRSPHPALSGNVRTTLSGSNALSKASPQQKKSVSPEFHGLIGGLKMSLVTFSALKDLLSPFAELH